MERLASGELSGLIKESEAMMDAADMRLWELIKMTPVRWQLHSWGDNYGGFWAIGIIGQRVVWYNEIEDGFNISRYFELGVIAEYWCDQDELSHTIRALREQLETGVLRRRCGPPEAIDLEAN